MNTLKNIDIVDKSLLALNRLFNAKISLFDGSKVDYTHSLVDDVLNIGKQKIPFFVISNSILARVQYQFADLLNSNNYRSYEATEYLLNNDIQNRFQESNLQW